MAMTSRERLMAVLQHKLPDRVPVSTYDMTGWHYDPRDEVTDQTELLVGSKHLDTYCKGATIPGSGVDRMFCTQL